MTEPIHLNTRASTKKELFFYHNYLTGLIKALEGEYTVIDLRNESSIAGRISRVDGFMNIDMDDVIFRDALGNEYCFEQFFVRHRNIRYVHIPKELNCMELIQENISGMRRVKPDKRKITFKQFRALKYQQETVRSLGKTK
ncbi:U7 snRNA-associated Sm-like protein LSm10 [Diabrotica virgifera virgifera]|uniref:U7 snRNA-associated Sm-like protein LSm10 n=1 Tax=Diabrotica virgifera virgifera TaxID=50390 RepID=A0A6P7H0G4_DIAVI|nr:U7 snRNA-associated Sm-like protein LSm10 [Diabrotica virgifera virgifera]